MDATKIFDTLRQRYNDANDKYPDQVIAIATFGSQNYGISHEDSDIDTKTILLPSRADIINGVHVSISERIYPNGINQFKDFRDIINNIMMKGSIGFLECFYTPFFICNPNNASYWYDLSDRKAAMAHKAHDRILHCARGMAKSYYEKVLQKNDFKSKIHLLWMYIFIRRFTLDNDFNRAIKLGMSYNEVRDAFSLAEPDWEQMLRESFSLKEEVENNEKERSVFLEEMKTDIMEAYCSELF